MGLRIDWIAIDCENPSELARFWREALDYNVAEDDDPDEVLLVPKDGSRRRLLLLKVPDDKIVKNRLHLDLRPDDQGAEVARLESLGAKRIDIGQGDVTWVVMADPEGNEFCVLRALRPDESDDPYGD
jgi:predicted enzyme related to lactoylglutathione lyase